MNQRESFTWIGPVSEASSAGLVARGFQAGLEQSGSLASFLDTGDGAVAGACDLDCAVRTRGSTVVRQAPLSKLAATAAIAPLEPGTRQVAYVVVDAAVPGNGALEILGFCHEVWAPSTLQAELLCSLGVERARVHVVAPGAQPARRRDPRPASIDRALVIGDARMALQLERNRVDGPHFEPALAPIGSPAFAREIERTDLVVVSRECDPWGTAVTNSVALGKPLFHVESGTALEYLDPGDCVWFDAGTAADPLRLAQCVRSACEERDALARTAERARARIEAHDSLEAAARALVARATRPRRLPPERLDRLLAELGLPTSAERLAGSRPRVLLLPVTALEGAWREALRAHLAAHEAHAGTTLCLWVDDVLAARTDEISTLVQGEIARFDAPDLDVLVVVAPLAHAPREHVVTSAA